MPSFHFISTYFHFILPSSHHHSASISTIILSPFHHYSHLHFMLPFHIISPILPSFCHHFASSFRLYFTLFCHHLTIIPPLFPPSFCLHFIIILTIISCHYFTSFC